MIDTIAGYRNGVVEADKLERAGSPRSKSNRLFALMVDLAEFELQFKSDQAALTRMEAFARRSP